MNRYTKALLVALGTCSVALGVVRMVLPLIPTTPFLLLAVYCYGRSSPRFLRWLLANRCFGAYLDNYLTGRGMVLRDKVVSLTTLWIALGITGATAVTGWRGRALLAAVGVGVTAHLVRLRTHRSKRRAADHQALSHSDEGAGGGE